MKGLISIWLALQSVLDGVKGRTRLGWKVPALLKPVIKGSEEAGSASSPQDVVVSQERWCNCKLIFKWALVWSLPGGGNTLSLKEQKRASQRVPDSRAVRSGEWRPSRMYEQRGHLPASYSEWTDSYQRPRVQCPRAEWQGWGAGRVKGWTGAGVQDKKQRLENSKVKEWLWICMELCLCSDIKTPGDRISRRQTQLTSRHGGGVLSDPAVLKGPGAEPATWRGG